MKTLLRAATLALSLLGGFTAQAQPLPADVAPLVRALPPESETLAVVRGPVVFPRKAGTWRDFPVSQRYFFVSNLQLSVIAPNLPGRVIELSLEGRRRFRAPGGFGLMPYDGSGLVRLRPVRGQTREALARQLARGATRSVVVAGQKVSVFEQKREQDLWRVYVAVPRPNLVVLATDEGSLNTTLRRLSGRASGASAFPASWPGWSLVDTNSPFWAVRRLAPNAPWSIVGPPHKDPQGVAFAAQVGPGAKAPLLMRYRSRNLAVGRKMFQIVRSELRSGVTLRQNAPDVSQISVDAGQGEEMMASFYLLGFLGTGVFV